MTDLPASNRPSATTPPSPDDVARGASSFSMWVGAPDRSLTVVSLRGSEGISRTFSFVVRVLAGEASEGGEASLAGKPAELRIAHAGGSAHRVVRGVIASVRRESRTGARGLRVLELRLVPRFWLLKKRVTSRVFQDTSVPLVISRVLEAAGVPSASRLVRPHAARAYCVQYQESDHDFVTRLAAEEGLFFWFEPAPGPAGGDEVVVFADDAAGYATIAGPREIRLREAAGASLVEPDEVSVFSLRRAVSSDAVLLRDYDFKRPLLDLRADAPPSPASALLSTAVEVAGAIATAAAPAPVAGAIVTALQAGPKPGPQGDLGVYDHRGEYEEPEVDPTRAAVHLEQHRARLDVGEGASSCRRLAPGHRFHLEVDTAHALSGDYVITSLRHKGYTPELATPGTVRAEGRRPTYTNRFTCVPSTVPARPPRPARRRDSVLATAVVVGPPLEEIHTDPYGRIKVQFHWDLDGRLDGFSSCWIRVAQSWAGASWGSQFIPRVGMEVIVSFLGGDQDCPIVTGCVYNATHPPPFALPTNKTRSGLRTESSPGGKGHNELSFQDAKGHEQIYLHAQRDLVEVVESRHDLEVRGNESIRVVGSQHVDVTGKRAETIEADDARLVRGSASVTIEGSRLDVVRGSSDRRVEGELATRSGSERRRVDGRTEITLGDDVTVRAEGCHTTVVGKADQKRSFVVHVEGPATISSSETVEIAADKSLVLRCGRSFIKISDDKIEIASPSVSAKGDGSSLSVGNDELRLNAGAAVVSAKSALIKTPDASLSMKSDVQVDGKRILFNSPDKVRDPVEDKAPPRTTIQLKDQAGKPLGYERFVVTLDDGSEVSGVLDKDGKCEIDLAGPGSIVFPDLGTANA
jgi:type VI secretion system secreted protein VgrG